MNDYMAGIQILVSDTHGIGVPQQFIRCCCAVEWHVEPRDAAVLSAGPEHEDYWEVWNEVLDSAYYEHPDGYRYTLHQDGDLFAVCGDLMTNEEYENLYGETKPCPDGWDEYAACEDCVMYIANGELPPDNTEAQDQALMDAVAQLGPTAVVDGADLGFHANECEICGALPGNRTRVMAKQESEAPAPKPERLTPVEYADRGGCVCPRCGSSDLSGQFISIDEGGAHQPMHCDACGANWVDTYTLSGYVNLDYDKE